jgi:uncharacterized membrane protein
MLRISAFVAVLAGTIAMCVLEAQAQTSAMERCVAACKAQGGKRCDNYCERARANR